MRRAILITISVGIAVSSIGCGKQNEVGIKRKPGWRQLELAKKCADEPKSVASVDGLEVDCRTFNSWYNGQTLTMRDLSESGVVP